MDRDRFDIRPFCLCIVSTLDKQLTTINVVLNAQFRWFWLKSWRHASRNESMFKTPNGVCVWYDRTHMINPLAIEVVFSLIKYSTIGTTTRQSFRVILIWKLLTNRKIHITACHLSDRRVYIENETFSRSLLGAASGFRQTTSGLLNLRHPLGHLSLSARECTSSKTKKEMKSLFSAKHSTW